MSFALDLSRPLAAIVVGRAGMDLYPLPDGTETEHAGQFAAEVGGSAANIAVALCRQGHAAALLGALSDDAVGRFVRRHLTRLGVDTSRCRTVGGRHRTSLAICETRHQDSETVFYRNHAVDLELRADDFDADFIASASVLIVTGTALAAEPSRTAALQAIALGRHAGTFTILDVDHRAVSWPSAEEATTIYALAASRCDAVVGNDDEFGLIAGNAAAGLAAATALVTRGTQFAIFKKGGAGSITITAQGSFESDVFVVEVKKPFGAGDAFLGNLVSTLLQGQSLERAVQRASAAAAYVVARRGCAFAMPTAAELDTFHQALATN
ncbi:MAG: 5-dehydro-2-deoxygluconokinase [Steroidobacteraceae bacterium]